jgi:hypothetical protein
MRTSALSSQQSLTFTDYFKLNLDIEDVAAYFGYSFASTQLALPRSSDPIVWYDDLHTRIQSSLPYISLTSEVARREFLIAPIVLDLARHQHIKVKVEFLLEVSEKLCGTIDYFMQADQAFLIIEAKNADLQRGFLQLCAELIALDQWSDDPAEMLYAAVSIGNVWQFGALARTSKHISQDLNLYRVPADLRELLQVLLGVLQTNP